MGAGEPTIGDRAAGSLLGLLLGDAIGATSEGGMIAKAAMGVVRLAHFGRLTYTDDGEMALALVKSLIRKETVDQEDIARSFGEELTIWRGYAPGALKTLILIRGGEPFRSAARSSFPDGSWGNGGAMRAAPIGPFCRGDADEVRRVADLQAEITHAHPLGREGAVLVALAAGEALLASHPGETVERLIASCGSVEFRTALERIPPLLGKPFDPYEVVSELGHDVSALRSVPAAIYLSSRWPEDFSAAVDAAIQLGGDTDTIAAMAGGIIGARVGRSGLPEESLSRLERADALADLAQQFGKLVERRRV